MITVIKPGNSLKGSHFSVNHLLTNTAPYKTG